MVHHRHSSILALASVAVAVGACQCDDELSVVPGSVVGRVCDEASGQGLAGAALLLKTASGHEETAAASADGSFAFATVFPGVATLTVQLEVAREFTVDVESGEDAVVTDPACRDLPGVPGTGAVDGQVCNRHTGALVTDAQVIIQQPGGEAYVTATDSEGR